LRGAHFIAYLSDRLRSLRAVRLASIDLRYVFQRPVKFFNRHTTLVFLALAKSNRLAP